MNVKQASAFDKKKTVARFDKRIATWQIQSTDDPRGGSITADPEEDPITRDSNKTLSLWTLERILSMRNLKRTLSLWNLKTTIKEDSQELQGR